MGGAPKICKHSKKINLITSEQLKDPSQTFEVLIKKVASKEALEKRLRLANFSKEIIQQLNSEQLTTLQESLKSEAALWKQSFKFINKEQHQIGPSYIADKFGLPEHTKTEPCWVHSRRQFLELLPPEERNILLTGDPDQAFDPFSYIWCYSYPQIAAQNPILQAHFQHILHFENNIEEPQLQNHPDPEPVQDQIEPEIAQPELPPPPSAPKSNKREENLKSNSISIYKEANTISQYSQRSSFAESPECWNPEFQQVEIFADNFLIFSDNFHRFSSNYKKMIIIIVV